MALREKQLQQNYRPVIAVHKWFARRPGALFRSLLLSEFVDGSLKEKGTVENRNGVVRRFFPKRCDFDNILELQIQNVENWINNRPMKCLGFKSPRQVFDAFVAHTP